MGKRFLAFGSISLATSLGLILGLATLPVAGWAAVGEPLAGSTLLEAAQVEQLKLQVAQGTNRDEPEEATSNVRTSACPPSALSRFTRHRVQSGETLEAIAQQYNLQPPTLVRLNPNLPGSLPADQEVVVPPFNGIVVTVPQGQTWEQVATRYQSRADVLFEVNGCQSVVPERVFIPGLNWLTGGPVAAAGPANAAINPLRGYPLPAEASILAAYGWQTDPAQEKLVFNTGVTLAAAPETTVLAAGDGVVAFAGADNIYGSLVVVNHQQGLQTRYANLNSVTVTVGQTVRQGVPLGTVAAYGGAAVGEAAESFLFFEVRLNSDLGWVAQDPQNYIPSLAVR